MGQSSRDGGYLKTAGESIAVGVAAIYLIGYLVLRTEITVLGIPTGVDSFDHRYLFTGATYIAYVLQAGVAVLPTLVVLGLVLMGLSRLLSVAERRWAGARFMTAPSVQASTLLVVASAAVLTSLGIMKGWVSERELLLRRQASSPVASLLAYHRPDEQAFSVFLNHLAVFAVGVALIALAVRRARSFPILARAAVILVVLHAAMLPALFGALSVVRERPRMKLDDGQTGLLVWEDNDSYLLVADSNSVLIRRIKSEQKRVEFAGTDRLNLSLSPGGAAVVQAPVK